MSAYEESFHTATVCVVIPVTERNGVWLTRAAALFEAIRLDGQAGVFALFAELFPNNFVDIALTRGNGDWDLPFVMHIGDGKAYFLDRRRRVHTYVLMLVLQEYLLAHPGVGDIAFAWKSASDSVSPDSCRAGVCMVTRFVTREITTDSIIEDWCLERQLDVTSNLRSEDPEAFYTPSVVLRDDDEGDASDAYDEDDDAAEDE